MSVQILLPKLGFTMTEAELRGWLVDDGATVSAGQPLFEIEAEKSTVEVESPADGILSILKAPGEIYEVGALLGEIR